MLTNLPKDEILKMRGVEIQVFPPGPTPKQKNFGWIEDDTELAWFCLFGEGFAKKYRLDQEEDAW
jgi:hypothetical protein